MSTISQLAKENLELSINSYFQPKSRPILSINNLYKPCSIIDKLLNIFSKCIEIFLFINL